MSFLSSITPKLGAEMLRWIIEVGRMRGQALLCFVLALVKCTRIYFSGAKDAPCLQAHSKHCLWAVFSILQFSSVNLHNVRAFTSST